MPFLRHDLEKSLFMLYTKKLPKVTTEEMNFKAIYLFILPLTLALYIEFLIVHRQLTVTCQLKIERKANFLSPLQILSITYP